MKYNILGLGNQGKSSNVVAQRRKNLYLEFVQNPDKTALAAYPTPGTVMFSQPSANPTRGIWQVESIGLLFVVQWNVLYEISSTGAVTNRGTLDVTDTSGYVSMSDNGTSGHQLIIVTGAAGYIYNFQTHTLTKISDPDFPGGDTVTFLDSVFIVNKPSTGEFWISGQYDGTSWNASFFATAESNPDNLIAVAADKGSLVLFGSISTEVWYNSGALDFPFQRVQGAPSENGLASRWSLARCAGMWTGLFRNRQSSYSVAMLNGYIIQSISNPELDFIINGYSNPEDCTAFAYTLNGHAFYQITFNADEKTWLYDATTNVWSELESYGLTRHRAALGASYGHAIIVADYENGNLYTYDQTTYTDNGQPIIRELVGGHIFSSDTLNQIRIRRLRIDMEGGVGTTLPPGNDPTISLTISRDGGHTWGNELWTTYGKIGETIRRAEWRALGRARDWVFKVRISDPTKTVFIGAYIEADQAQA